VIGTAGLLFLFGCGSDHDSSVSTPTTTAMPTVTSSPLPQPTHTATSAPSSTSSPAAIATQTPTAVDTATPEPTATVVLTVHDEFLTSADDMMGWISTVVAQGIRRPGYPADVWAEQWIRDQFTAFGLQDPTLDPVQVKRWQLQQCSLMVWGDAAPQDVRSIPCFAVPYSAATLGLEKPVSLLAPDADVTDRIAVVEQTFLTLPQTIIRAFSTREYDPDGEQGRVDVPAGARGVDEGEDVLLADGRFGLGQGGWVLRGQKQWITSGAYAGVFSTVEEREGHTRIYYTGNQGKRIGESRVMLDAARHITDVTSYMHFLTVRYPIDKTMDESIAGGMAGTLIMGLTFALTSFACVGPFFGSILTASVQSGGSRPPLGMISFAAGLAAPFFFLAAFPSYLKKLPRSGGWMLRIKVVMGFILLAVMLKYLANIDQVMQWNFLTRERFLAAWFVMFALAGLYLLGFLRLEGVEPGEPMGIGRLLTASALLIFAISLLPGMFGAPLGELDAFVPVAQGPGIGGRAAATGPAWMKNQYPEALAKAKQENKLVLVSFTGYACTNCHWMKSNMFPRPEIAEAMKDLVLVEIYTDERDQNVADANQKLEAYYGPRYADNIYR
jgi:hypothetical protein